MANERAPHRFWLIALGFAVTLGFAIPLSGEPYGARLKQTQAQLETRKTALEGQLRQWRDDAREAKELSAAMQGDDVESYLAPMDRAALAAQIEPLATAAHLSAMTYTIGPEEKWPGNPAFPGIEGLGQSQITIEAQAALDTDIFHFLRSLTRLPGRLTLEHLTLTRKDPDTKHGLGLANVHAQMTLTWLANAPTREASP